MDYRPGKITRPLQESFGMCNRESLAFWTIIMAEYPLRYVREMSIVLYTNPSKRLPVLSGEDHEHTQPDA